MTKKYLDFKTGVKPDIFRDISVFCCEMPHSSAERHLSKISFSFFYPPPPCPGPWPPLTLETIKKIMCLQPLLFLTDPLLNALFGPIFYLHFQLFVNISMGHTNNSELWTCSAVGLEQKDTKLDLVLKIRFLISRNDCRNPILTTQSTYLHNNFLVHSLRTTA